MGWLAIFFLLIAILLPFGIIYVIVFRCLFILLASLVEKAKQERKYNAD